MDDSVELPADSVAPPADAPELPLAGSSLNEYSAEPRPADSVLDGWPERSVDDSLAVWQRVEQVWCPSLVPAVPGARQELVGRGVHRTVDRAVRPRLPEDGPLLESPVSPEGQLSQPDASRLPGAGSRVPCERPVALDGRPAPAASWQRVLVEAAEFSLPQPVGEPLLLAELRHARRLKPFHLIPLRATV